MKLNIFVCTLMTSCFYLGQSDDSDTRARAFHRASMEHLKSHLKGVHINPESSGEQQMAYYFFWSHDYDKNRMLDGLELITALSHEGELQRADDRDDLTPEEKAARKKHTKDKLMNSVDRLLESDDENDDGYISWQEYTNAQRTKEAMLTADAH